IEGIFENLFRSYNSINKFVLNNVKTFNKSIEAFDKNLKFINKISMYFSTYKKFLNLAEKEKPVYAIYAKLTNGLNTEEKYKKDRGILFITNFDLSFVHEYGIRKKKQALSFKAPVQDLIRIRDKGKLFKKLYIEFEYGKYEFTLPPKAVSRVIEYILLARTFDETTIFDDKSAAKLQRVNTNLDELVDFIEESINSFFSLKCQYNKGFDTKTGYGKAVPQNLNLPPNHIQGIVPQTQYPPYHYNNPNFGHYGNKTSQQQDHISLYPPYYSPTQIESPQAVNNFITPPNQYQGPAFNRSKFFPQNLYNPNRFQNYDPLKANSGFENLLDIDERDNMMRNLEQSSRTTPIYEEYNRNHLSELFNPNSSLIQQSYGRKRKLFKLDKEKHEKMLELEKERYSLKATLKKLETKFDQGSISESDYFRTFRNLNKEIYLIDNKIDSLRQNLEELESLKQTSRNFDNKRFYT
ncbi:MAG: hypothetical protein ACFFFB_25790, partial [Candidatus Heimdallarchaeota archaeon]